MHTSSCRKQEEDPTTNNTHMDTRRRYTPYAIPHHHQSSTLYKQDQVHVNMEERPNPLEKRMEEIKRDGNSGSWFKITIPFGIKYEEKWLLNLIQSQCSIPFIPFEFHYEKMQAHFFVENARIAFELKSISEKIWDENYEKISVFISPCDVPQSVKKEPTSEKKEQMKLTMNKQCDASQQFLDMQRLRHGQDFMTHTADRALIPVNYMASSPNYHEENIIKLLPLNTSLDKPYQLFGPPDAMPMVLNTENLDEYKKEVTYARGIVKEQQLEPEETEACAESNPLCTIIPDKSSNLNSILELFPKLLSLDGQESPKPAACGIEDDKNLPTCKGSFFGSEMIKAMVLQFLQQYFMIYDHGDRQELLGVYHNKACFSLSVLSSVDPAPNRLSTCFKHSRNIKILKDPYVQRYLLKHNKCDIISCLRTLPKTLHDLSSFVVDMCFQTESMLCFCINGVFKEMEGRSQGCVRVFTRTFITTFDNNSSLCIVNDKLFVRNIQGIAASSLNDRPMPSSSYVPVLSQEQLEMLQAFFTHSGKDFDMSQKCLHDNNWDYRTAPQILPPSKEKDEVPEENITETEPGS